MIKLAAMTYLYKDEPFERALQGIKAAGYKYIAFGLPHEGKPFPDLTQSEPAKEIRKLLNKYEMEPVMLIGTKALAPNEPIETAQTYFEFANQLGVPEVLSTGTSSYEKFPHTPRSADDLEERNRIFVEKFKPLAALAKKMNIVISLKPHTGNTATGSVLKELFQQIGSPHVQASYDPGNVHFYEGIDAAKDFQVICKETVSYIAKDHRGERANQDFPVPGEGDIDFLSDFKLLKAIGFNGPVIVERVDGQDGKTLRAEETGRRLSAARFNLEKLLEKAGCQFR